MGDYGIKVSQPGYSALTAADKNLILKSDFTLLKAKMFGTTAITAGEATVYHGLGYKPQFLVWGFVEYPGDPDIIRYVQTSNPVFEFVGIFASVDNNNLYIYSDAYTTSAKYFIFYEGI